MTDCPEQVTFSFRPRKDIVVDLLTRSGDGFVVGLPPGTLLMMGDQTKGKGMRQHLHSPKPNGEPWWAFNAGG